MKENRLPLQSKWRSWIYGLLPLLLLPTYLQAQEDFGAAEAFTEPIRLNLVRPTVLSPNGQNPPYGWSAVYVANAFGNASPSGEAYFRDSSICSVGVPNTTNFMPKVKIFYTYAADGSTESITYQERIGDAFVNLGRRIFSFENGKLESYLYQKWLSGTESWEDSYEETCSYDPAGRIRTVLVKEGSGNLMNVSRSRSAYDEEGNLKSVLTQLWEGGNWEDQARQMYQYNDVGAFKQSALQTWTGAAWETITQDTATYDDFGFEWETYELKQWNDNTNQLEPVIREQYGYNNEGFWESTTRQVWDVMGQAWENAIRENYGYTRRGIWTSWTQQIWENDDWMNTIRQRYDPAGDLRVDLMQVYDAGTDSWTNAFRAFNRFNENGNLVREAGSQLSNPLTMEWVNTEETRQCFHNYSARTATNLIKDLPSLECLVVNPYRLASPIHCKAMEPGNMYDVRLLNLEGKSVFQRSVRGGEQFAIDRPNLSRGMYYLNIYENGKPRFVQKLLITQ